MHCNRHVSRFLFRIYQTLAFWKIRATVRWELIHPCAASMVHPRPQFGPKKHKFGEAQATKPMRLLQKWGEERGAPTERSVFLFFL